MWNGASGVENLVDRFERSGEQAGLEVCAVARGVHVGEIEHRPHPARLLRDLDDIVHRAEVAYATHHLDAEGNGTALALQSLAERAELLHDRGDRVLARAAEEKAWMEDDDFCAARGSDPRAAVERADGGRELSSGGLDVAHEPEERSVHRQRHVGGAGGRAESLGPGIVHPEPALEVDLARVVAALEQNRDRPLRVVARRNPRQADTNTPHLRELYVVRPAPYALVMDQPTRIDLLELDIDLRLADLWREAADVTEWNLEVVSAFMRAAYGKGYCDAFTEDSPGSLCHDHGYEIPGRPQSVRAA